MRVRGATHSHMRHGLEDSVACRCVSLVLAKQSTDPSAHTDTLRVSESTTHCAPLFAEYGVRDGIEAECHQPVPEGDARHARRQDCVQVRAPRRYGTLSRHDDVDPALDVHPSYPTVVFCWARL